MSYGIELTCEVSGKSVANSRKNESPNLSIFTKKCTPEGKRLPPSIQFFVINIGKFRLPYFREFATDFPETSQINSTRYDKSIHGDDFLFYWKAQEIAILRDIVEKVHYDSYCQHPSVLSIFRWVLFRTIPLLCASFASIWTPPGTGQRQSTLKHTSHLV